MEHFKEPHNYGKMENADGVGKVGNIRCGDVMWLYIKVSENEVIEDVKFQTYGCLAAIATSSVITDMIKGKTIEEALNIDREQIVRKLGGLPPIKIHCSVLGVDALFEAVHNYLKKKGKKIPRDLEERHEKIKREKEKIEERHGDWTEFEEKLREEN